MPFLIFYKAQPSNVELIITPLSPFNNESNIPKNSDLFFGIHLTAGNPLNINFDSLDLTWKSVSAIINGVAQDGFSYSRHVGYFNGHLGWIIHVVNTATSYTPSSPTRISNPLQIIQAETYVENNSNTLNVLSSWEYYTNNKNAFDGMGYFGNYPGGRFYLLTTDISPSQISEAGLIITTSQFISVGPALDAFAQSGAIVVEPNSTSKALGEFDAVTGLGDLTTRQEYTEDQIVGRPSPMPTFMGPMFGSIQLIGQKESLKLQVPSGRLLTEASDLLITEDGEGILYG